jgi:transcriptional regulator with XRE-family HTH domain
LLCGYDGSLSRICRKSRISRQQLGRYLSGGARPSLATLRRLCDYFGLEDHEIHLDYESFRKLIQCHPRVPDRSKDPLATFGAQLAASHPRRVVEDRGLLGLYHAYHRPRLPEGNIVCSLVRLYTEAGLYRTRTIERYRDGQVPHASLLKYEGFVLESENRLYIHEQQRFGPTQKWVTVLSIPAHSFAAYLTGLTLGTTPDTDQLVCYRVVWKRVDERAGLKAALSACGSFAPNHPALPHFVASAVSNESDGEAAFMPRLR